MEQLFAVFGPIVTIFIVILTLSTFIPENWALGERGKQLIVALARGGSRLARLIGWGVQGLGRLLYPLITGQSAPAQARAAVPPTPQIMESAPPPWRADRQTDRQTDGHVPQQTAIPAAYLRLQQDITKAAVIDALLEAGWGVGDIRGVLKGDNTKMSAEIKAVEEERAARRGPVVTPIAERPTGAQFQAVIGK